MSDAYKDIKVDTSKLVQANPTASTASQPNTPLMSKPLGKDVSLMTSLTEATNTDSFRGTEISEANASKRMIGHENFSKDDNGKSEPSE